MNSTPAVQSNSAFRELAPLAQSMVLATLRAPRSGAYVIQDVCEFQDDLNVGLLKDAWAWVARKHPALRTRLVREGSERFQAIIEKEPAICWRLLDSINLPEYLAGDRENGFDFAAGVPLRIAVIRERAQKCTVILTIHHALVDGRSLLMVWKDWMSAYDTLIRGHKLEIFEATPANPPPGLCDGAETYWREHLAGMTQTTGFIVDRVFRAPARAESAFRKESQTLSKELSQNLASFAERNGVMLNTLIQGAFALLLSRYSASDDVVFGVTRTGREAANDQVGVFINTLPLRIRVRPDVSAGTWLQQIRENWLEQRMYEHAPLEKIAEWAGLSPGTRLFDSVLVYDHVTPGEALHKLGGDWQRRNLTRHQRTDSPFTLVAYGQPCVRLEIVHDTRRFSEETVARLLRHLVNLLHAFVKQPNCALSVLKMVTGAEENWLLEEVNQAKTSFPHELCVHELLEDQVRLQPTHTALETSAEKISYSELNERANQVGRFLHEKGVGAEDVVAVCFPRSPEAVIAAVGVLKAGAVFLPFDASLPEERIVAMIRDSAAKALLTDRARVSCAELDVILFDEIPDVPANNLGKTVASENAAYAIYTSGSTGTPKAAVITHRSLVNYVLAARQLYSLSSSDRRLQFASLNTDLFVAEVFNYLCSGATLAFGLDRRDVSIREFVKVLDEHRITVTGLPSSWWNEWVEAMRNGIALPGSLRAVIAGMEQVNASALMEWQRITHGRVRWFNAYGPTETTCTATIYEAGTSAWESESLVPIGKPISNVCAYVLDESRSPVPVGVVGELYIGGEGVGRGYLNNPAETDLRFVPDHFQPEPGRRLYRTGDLVYRLPDGNLVFVGRKDRQVKIRGYRIELEEVETALAEHESIRHCAVIASGANGRQRLVAYLTPNERHSPSISALRIHMARRLPAHMVPSTFVTLHQMPRTASGKIDRQALPLDQGELRAQTEDAPEFGNETEERLARLWEETLGIARVGLTKDFFELGGNSLNATRLITLIFGQFNLAISLEDLLRAPTVAAMARTLQGGQRESVIAIQPEGTKLPLFCITTTVNEPRWFRRVAELLGHDQPVIIVPHLVPDGEGLDRASQRVATLAEESCRAILETRPNGPYVLAGYCLAGIVAYETAKRLNAAGAAVRLVILFDAPTPGYPRLTPRKTHYWRRFLRAMKGERIGWREIVPHFTMIRRLVERKAAAAYAPQPAAIDVLQFIADGEPISTEVLEDARLGWRDVSKGTFSVHRVRATHENMFHEANVSELVGKLRESLTGNGTT